MSPTYRYQRGIGMPAGLSLGPPGPLPPMVKALIVANTAAYLLQLLTPDSVLVLWFGLIPRAVIGGLELWRVATYQFLHGGVWHLALNMLVLWMFGTELEQRWGPRFFLKYYMLCAVGGGLTYTFVRAGSPIPSVGASGAIYGVLLAYGMWFPNRVVLLVSDPRAPFDRILDRTRACAGHGVDRRGHCLRRSSRRDGLRLRIPEMVDQGRTKSWSASGMA